MQRSFERIPPAGRWVRGAAVAAVAVLATVGAAEAGGYDTGERDWDFLFQQKPVAFEAGVRYIDPQRTLTNVTPTLVPITQPSVREAEAFAVARLSAAARIAGVANCMASYREPWGGHANYGQAWVGAAAAIEQHFSSTDIGLTCSAGLPAGPGVLHILGGVSYQEIDYELTQFGGPAGLRTTQVGDHGIGWRGGVAYEIPEYALRASLIYNSAIDYDMTGTLTMSALPGAIPIFGSITMPQSVELKVQSGVAPGWLAFGSVRWTDWSVADNMPLCPVGLPACTQLGAVSGLTLLWQDSWTVTVGAAHPFSPQFALAPSITWDQGASRGFTSQTDTWTFSLTAIVTPSDTVELKLGGLVGVMTGGSVDTRFLPGGIPNPVGYTATFGNDLIYALSASGVVRF